nr:MAG TPA: hypothetical protein [Caudoviricetes sp.]
MNLSGIIENRRSLRGCFVVPSDWYIHMIPHKF